MLRHFYYNDINEFGARRMAKVISTHTGCDEKCNRYKNNCKASFIFIYIIVFLFYLKSCIFKII